MYTQSEVLWQHKDLRSAIIHHTVTQERKLLHSVLIPNEFDPLTENKSALFPSQCANSTWKNDQSRGNTDKGNPETVTVRFIFVQEEKMFS